MFEIYTLQGRVDTHDQSRGGRAGRGGLPPPAAIFQGGAELEGAPKSKKHEKKFLTFFPLLLIRAFPEFSKSYLK